MARLAPSRLCSLVAYYSCLTCGAMWNIERNANRVGSADEANGPQRHRDHLKSSDLRS